MAAFQAGNTLATDPIAMITKNHMSHPCAEVVRLIGLARKTAITWPIKALYGMELIQRRGTAKKS